MTTFEVSPLPEGVEYVRTTQGRSVVGGTPQTVDEFLTQIEATPVVELTTQEELLTALDELLDNALHGPDCYIDPDDTHCDCVIGKVRAVLPRCSEYTMTPGGVPWRCLRTAHPAQPDRHYFSEE